MSEAAKQAALEAIAKADATKSGNFLRANAIYRLKVEKVVAFKGYKGLQFIAECRVLEMTPTGQPSVNPKTKQPMPQNAVGTLGNFHVNLDNDAGPGNVKAFLMALLNEPEEEISIGALTELCSDKQPLKGLEIWDETFEKPLQNSPGNFTHHRWEHIPGQNHPLGSKV